MKKKILIFIVLLLFVSFGIIVKTYSRYNSGASGNKSVQIAKWGVKLNGVPMTSEEQMVQITMENAECVEGCDVVPGKIAPGSVYKIPIVLDAFESEVSFKYDLGIQPGNFPTEFGFAAISDGITESDYLQGSIIYNPNPNIMVKYLNLFVYISSNYNDSSNSLSDIYFYTHIMVSQCLNGDVGCG